MSLNLRGLRSHSTLWWEEPECGSESSNLCGLVLCCNQQKLVKLRLGNLKLFCVLNQVVIYNS